MNVTERPGIVVPPILFSWVDFVLFGLMLGVSAVIGIYYGFFGAKQETATEYLLGGKTMQIFPVAMSLVASHTSGIALLSVPADIFVYGGTYFWISLGIIMNSVITCFVFMPVFLKLQLTSTYEYLKLRFDNKIRLFASFLYTLSVFFYNPIVIYVPALAFAQVTGINLHLITPIVCIICIFYTTVGGLKAVVWTDTIQTAAIAGSMVMVFTLGVVSAGGFSYIIQKSTEGHRLDILDFNLDITKRDSFWALSIGAGISWTCNFGVNQGTIQRFLSVPSMNHARKVVVIFCIGVVLVKSLSTFTGLIMYAKYAECDPLLSKQIQENDQLLPYYIMDVARAIPGLSGLFIAGVFSAGLSTLSTTLNTLSATIYGDFVSPFMPPDISQKRVSNILKLIVVITGSISTALVFVVEHLGGILPLVVTVGGITSGPLLGLFTLGMLFPVANTKGALCGGIGGLLFSSWMIMGSQIYKQMGWLPNYAKPRSISGCDFYVNVTETVPPLPEDAFFLYRISFWYYTLLGTIVVITIGLIVSWFTRKDDPPVHPDLLSPVIHRFLSKEQLRISPDYLSVEKALHLLTLNSDKEEK